MPAGATAVGIPARIIPSKKGESADVTEASPKFTAYGITQEDDPVSQARAFADAGAPPESRGPIQPAKDGARVVKVETDGPGLRPGTRVDGGAK